MNSLDQACNKYEEISANIAEGVSFYARVSEVMDQFKAKVPPTTHVTCTMGTHICYNKHTLIHTHTHGDDRFSFRCRQVEDFVFARNVQKDDLLKTIQDEAPRASF